MTDEDGMQSLLGAYAIGAVDDLERARVERHLADHPDDRAEVDRLAGGFEETLTSLVQTNDLPDDLWSKIAAQLPERAGTGDPVVIDGASNDRVPVEAPPPVVVGDPTPSAPRQVRRRRPLAATLAAAAALVVLVAFGSLAISHSLTSPRSVQDLAAQALRQPSARQVNLRTADGSAASRIVIDGDGHAYVLPAGLPALHDDQTYQLWSVDAGRPTSIGLLGSGADPAQVTIGSDVHAVAISVEPAGGSAQPTTTPIAAGQLA